MRWVTGIVAAGAALLLGTAAPAAQSWTPAWTASMWRADAKQQLVIENATISFAVRVGASGKKMRLKLSNEYGAPLRIGAATIRIAGGKTIPVTFDRQRSVALSAKADVMSDATALPVKAFDVVEVSLYLPERTVLNTVHGSSGTKTLISAAGDHSASPFEAARKIDFRPLLASIELTGAKARPVVVAFGDSITDNPNCANEAVPICRWGDVLGRRLAAAGKPHVVVTQAISGNRVLTPGANPSALERFDRDVLALPGVTHMMILEGVNDIGGSGRVRPDGSKAPTITAEQLIDGYRQLIDRAHARGIKVMGMTIMPYEGAGYHTETGEVIRGQVNDWIRTSGAFDAVFDMEKVIADPANPKRLDPAFHRGDFLHPNASGQTKMGEAIPLQWFKP